MTVRFQADVNLNQIILRAAVSLASISNPQKLPALLAFLILRY
jgi:hypothetical protein